MADKKKWVIYALAAISAVEIFFVFAAFSKLTNVFQVIVVSFLAYIYMCIVESSHDLEKHKLSILGTLYKILGRGNMDDESEKELKDNLSKRASNETADAIPRIGHLIIVLIILYNFVKAVFLS